MSVKKNFEIDLDLKRSVSNESFEIVEGDNGNTVTVRLFDSGVPVDITDCRVIAVFSKSNGTSSQDSSAEDGGITVSDACGGTFEIELFLSSFAPGMVECEIQLYSGDSGTTLVTSAKFNFSCRRGIFNADTALSTNEYPLLVSLIDRVNTACDILYNGASHAALHASGGIDALSPADIGAARPKRLVTVNLTDQWDTEGASDVFAQEVEIIGLADGETVDLLPDMSVITSLTDDGVAALYIENDSGTATAYAIGAPLSTPLAIQAAVSDTR